jgi:Zn ribbon nucleic-acid-binding protein
MGSKLIGFRVADDLAQGIEAKAAEKGLSTSELIRKLVDKELYPSKSDKGEGEVAELQVEGLEQITEQMEELAGRVNELTERENQRVDQPGSNSALVEKLNNLERAFVSLSGNYEADQKFAVTFAKQVDPLKAKVLKLHLCPDCGAPLHIHHFVEGRFHLECVECGFCSKDYEYPGWKEEREKLGVLEQREVEQEEPEKPYLHIIDKPREGYFPWTEGKWAKIVE